MSESAPTTKKASSVTRVRIGDEDLGAIDFEKLSVSDAILIKAKSGLTTKQFLNGLGELDGLTLQALVWLLRRRKGQDVELHAINFTIGDFHMDDEPDPTTETSGVVDASTSVSSPTSVI